MEFLLIFFSPSWCHELIDPLVAVLWTFTAWPLYLLSFRELLWDLMNTLPTIMKILQPVKDVWRAWLLESCKPRTLSLMYRSQPLSSLPLRCVPVFFMSGRQKKYDSFETSHQKHNPLPEDRLLLGRLSATSKHSRSRNLRIKGTLCTFLTSFIN